MTNRDNLNYANSLTDKHRLSYRGYAYIYTIGCQMNSYDSEKISDILDNIGYAKTEKLERADIVVCNTCSIREKAQEKAFSFLGTLANRKRKNTNLISIMAGCVAQQEGASVFKRIPHLDIVMGTQAFERLPKLIEMVLYNRESGSKKQITDIEESSVIFESMPNFATLEREKISRFVTIMQGCNNFCTYCIVPYVRGRERSRTAESIVEEIKILADSGVKEVTLLGQNVNSYGGYNDHTLKTINTESQRSLQRKIFQDQHCTFPELLAKINNINGIERIRFATSHPKDISDELIFAIRDLKKVCNQLHLPVQSGSNSILKKMNRGYNREAYLERIETLRKHCPDIGISSDMIVGFPSESREDFEQTLDLVRTVEFDGLFAFAYSDRPNAPAAKFSGHIDDDEKLSRLNELLAIQEHYTEKRNQALIGTVHPVLVEGKSLKRRHEENRQEQQEKRKDGKILSTLGDISSKSLTQMTGRTESGKIVHFYADNINQGQMVDIYIEYAYPHSLWGVVQKNEICR